MPIITVSRPRQFGDFLRKYKLLIDGEYRAGIRSGETLELTVDPGPHTLQERVDWMKTEEVPFDTSEEKLEFEVRNGLTAFHYLLGPLALLITSKPWIMLERMDESGPS